MAHEKNISKSLKLHHPTQDENVDLFLGRKLDLFLGSKELNFFDRSSDGHLKLKLFGEKNPILV